MSDSSAAARRLAVVVLAAGQGTRMKSAKPKVLHELAGRSLLGHVLEACRPLQPDRVAVVVGPGMEAVTAAAAPHATLVQEERLGTGHAVGCARPALEQELAAAEPFDLLVVYGDTPLLRPETLARLVEGLRAPDGPALLGLAFRPEDPGQYGRVVLDDSGQVSAIVEFAEAGPEQRRIDLCNGGILAGEGHLMFELIGRLRNDNAKGEFYLTDLFALARAAGQGAMMIEAEAEEVLGVNSREELAGAEALVQRRLRREAMAGGATLVDPESVWLSSDTRLGRDVVIQPQVFFGPGVTVEEGAEIRSFSHLEGAKVGPGAVVGPFARLRPGARLGEGSHVGNFVELKNAELGAGAKANHLTYLGDAVVGAKANIGAGTITCNYDGFGKYRTEIGAGAFIGSNSALVAPLSIGAGAIVGAGSTITRDVSPDAIAIARSEQKNADNAAKGFREKRRKT